MMAPGSQPRSRTPLSPIATVLLGLVAVGLALRLHLLFRVNFNWDEFHYLAFVHDYLRGSLEGIQQTFHVHLFSWLPAVAPGDEIAQLTVARLVVFALGLGSSLLIYRIGRRFLSIEGALFALLCFTSLSNVLVHGAGFRPDPILTLLALSVLWGLIGFPGRPSLVVSGLMIAVAALITPKIVFFLPTFAAVRWLSLSGERRLGHHVRELAVLGVSAAGSWAVLRALHSRALAEDAFQAEVKGLGQAFRKVVWTGDLFPQGFDLAQTLDRDRLTWLLLAGGVVAAVAALRSGRGEKRTRAFAMLSLVLPLTTVIFYRNSFPYYYVPIMAFGVVLCGAAFDAMRRVRAAPRLVTILSWALVLGIAWGGLGQYLRRNGDEQATQREILATVHRMFPEPVPYIDRCSMVSSFPKVGFFMSTWGFDAYHSGGRPRLTEAVREHGPPFLIANVTALDLRLPVEIASRTPYRLSDEDARTLRENYVEHWGAIYVAGKRLEIGADGSAGFEILIPGTYTLESPSAVEIEEITHFPGTALELGPGPHTVSGIPGSTVVLRWGKDLYRPSQPPPTEPIFLGL